MIHTDTYKAQLADLLTQVTSDLKTLGVQNLENKSDWVATESATTEADPNTVADGAEEYEEREAILGDLEIRYNNIKRALQKIDAGTYGICEISGEEIESDRLDADPSARTCKAHREAVLPE